MTQNITEKQVKLYQKRLLLNFYLFTPYLNLDAYLAENMAQLVPLPQNITKEYFTPIWLGLINVVSDLDSLLDIVELGEHVPHVGEGAELGLVVLRHLRNRWKKKKKINNNDNFENKWDK